MRKVLEVPCPCLILIFLLRQKGCLPKVLEGLRRECRTWRGRPLRLVVWARGVVPRRSLMTNLHWAKILVHPVGSSLPSSLQVVVGNSNFSLQLWWEAPSRFLFVESRRRNCVSNEQEVGGGVEVSSHADQASGMRMHPLRNNLKQHQAPDHDDIGIAAKTTINAMQPYSGLHSIDGCLGYNAKISTIRSLMLFEVVSFAVFLTSSLVAHDLKIMIKLVNGAESNEEFI
ncbi:hypothetical protein CK203_093941 [Vitis vinifera]|uniref:Uncharacterized protein n=1 Tax=Vitis vinifera TaxID=29760 RepID=A0A438CTD6_VITVI|nr:hypothetical protein CK203_093941 [Vitis vinifera]